MINEWKPISRAQEQFLALPDTIKEGLFGGSAGPGKSEILMMYPIVREFIKHSRFKALFTRRTYGELKLEIIPRSRELYTAFGGKFNKSDLVWEFPSVSGLNHSKSPQGVGALIFFGHVENEDDVHKYDSMEINLFLPDEVQTFTELMYLYIAFTRVRTSYPELPALIRAAAMPGNIGHCIDYGEVLTPKGWIDIKDIKVGDSIYEVDSNGYLISSQVFQKHEHKFDGELLEINSPHLHISCTPEHSIARKNANKYRDNFVLTPANELPFQAQIRKSVNYNGEQFPLNIKIANKEIPYILYLKLLGWFLSEGYTLEEDYLVGICQSKEENRTEIYNLLLQCGLKFTFDNKQFKIYGKDFWNYFKVFGRSRDKFIPREVLNGFLLDELLDCLMKGDGHWQSDTNGYYYTISKQLADDVCELAVKCGWSVNLTSRQRKNRDGLSYQVSIVKKNYTEVLTRNSKKLSHLTKKKFDGLVYDIGVPLHHTFVIRQNGSVWISGNSWVKNRFIKPEPKGSKLILGRGGNKRIFIFSTLADNPKLDPNYANALEMMPEAEKRAKKYGDWNSYEGQVFEEFREKHYPMEPDNALHVIEPFDVPNWWPKILVIDWGYSAMTWAGYGAISPTKRIYIYREQHWRKTKIEEWASYVKENLDREEIKIIKVCKSAGQDRGQEHTIQQQIELALQRSVQLTSNSPGSRVAGKMLIHEYLRWIPKYVPPKEKEVYQEEVAQWVLRNHGDLAYKNYLSRFNEPEVETNIPKLLIFNTCPVLVEAIKSCIYDKTNPEDIAQFDGDDPIDGLRYIVDEADRYFAESENEFKKLEQRQNLIAEFEQTQDWNILFRRAMALEKQTDNYLKPVARYSHRMH